jgi:hypothetical protein
MTKAAPRAISEGRVLFAHKLEKQIQQLQRGGDGDDDNGGSRRQANKKKFRSGNGR